MAPSAQEIRLPGLFAEVLFMVSAARHLQHVDYVADVAPLLRDLFTRPCDSNRQTQLHVGVRRLQHVVIMMHADRVRYTGR